MKKFWPFWIFIVLFKFAADLHYDVMSPLGERILPIWLVGVLIGGCSLMQLFLDIPAGFLLDKYGYKRFLKMTTLFFMVAVLSLLFGLNKVTYFWTLIFSVFGWLFFSPGTSAYILLKATKENMGKFLSTSEVYHSTGQMLAGLSLMFFLNLPVRLLAILILIIFSLALIFLIKIPEDHVEEKSDNSCFLNKKRKNIKVVLKTISKLDPAGWVLIVTKLGSSVFYSIIWFVIPLMISSGEGGEIMGLSLGFFDLAIVLTGGLLGRLADKFNKKMLVFWGLLIFSVVGIILGLSTGWLFLILSFVATLGNELSDISLWTWLNGLCKTEDDDGLISGAVSLFEDFGWAIGPIMAGLLYSKVGPQFTIMAGGAVVLITFVVFLFKSKCFYDHSKNKFNL